MELSLVITVYNEEENIRPLLESVRQALKEFSYEVILVDDGSRDKTVQEIKAHSDEHVKLISLYRNYGQTAAMAAGIDAASGAYIVTLDGDLQNDPLDIPLMLEQLKREDLDVVTGNRKNRKDKALLRKIPSKLANRMIRNLTGVHVHDYGCTLKIFKRDIAKHLGLYGELHRFIPVLAVLQGARIGEMDVRHHARIYGKSKYGLGRTFRVVSDLMLMVFFQKYFRRPIHLFGPVGIISFLIGMFISLYLLYLKIMGERIGGRPLLLLGVVLIITGVQFVVFGLLSELMMRTYYESQNKKTYSIREVYTKGS